MSYNTDDLVDCIRDLLPMAEAYLKSAPSHPDNAKLETARAILMWREEETK